jgi:O-antigen/teichoic acid export membrane protein
VRGEHALTRRTRGARLTLAWGLVARGVGFASLLMSLRLSLPWLGEERFGVLATLAGLAAVLGFLDLGIGNGLVSAVARLEAAQDHEGLARQVSRGLLLATMAGLATAAVLLAAALSSPLAPLFRGASAGTLTEAREALSLLALFIGASLPLGAAQRVVAGLQAGYLAHAMTAGFCLMGLCLTALLPSLGGGIAAFLAASYGASVLSGLPLLVVLARRGLLVAPGSGWLRAGDTRALLGSGGHFMVLQIGAVIGAGADSVLVSALLGPGMVATLAVVQRLFLLASIPVQMVSLPLWAAYAHAGASGDQGFITRTFARSVRANLALAALVSMMLLTLADPLTHALSRGQVSAAMPLLTGFAIWSLCDAWGVAVSMRLNGAGVMRPQVITILAFVGLSVTLKIVLLPALGLTALPWLTATAWGLTVALPLLTIWRGHLRPQPASG